MSADPTAHVPRLLQAMDAYERALRVPPDRWAVEIDGEARALVSRAGLRRSVLLPPHSRSVALRDERGTLRAFALREETCAAMSRCAAVPVDPARSEQPMTQAEAGSVVVSLAELMAIEEERIESEEQARLAAERDCELRRQEHARRERQAEQARIAAEEQRRLEREARSREEAARFAALEKATVEQARAEQEQRARLQEKSIEQQHRAELAALQQDHQLRRLRALLVSVAAAFVIAGGAVALLWHQDHMRGELALAAQTTESQKLQTESARLERDKRNALATVEQLKTELADAERDLERARERADAAKEQAERDEVSASRPLRRPPTSTVPTPTRPCRFKGDPLCDLNGRSAIP